MKPASEVLSKLMWERSTTWRRDTLQHPSHPSSFGMAEIPSSVPCDFILGNKTSSDLDSPFYPVLSPCRTHEQEQLTTWGDLSQS